MPLVLANIAPVDGFAGTSCIFAAQCRLKDQAVVGVPIDWFVAGFSWEVFNNLAAFGTWTRSEKSRASKWFNLVAQNTTSFVQNPNSNAGVDACNGRYGSKCPMSLKMGRGESTQNIRLGQNSKRHATHNYMV